MKGFPFSFTTFYLLKAASGDGPGRGFLSAALSSCPSAAGRDEEGTELQAEEMQGKGWMVRVCGVPGRLGTGAAEELQFPLFC